MVKNDLLRMLYGGVTTISDFCYENLVAPPLNQILWHPNDIGDLNSIATSIRLSADIDKKYRYIDDIMNHRSMKRLAAGTNRLVYRHTELPSIVAKCAVDDEGITNNPDEFRCQNYIKPYCTKVFESSPDGAVGLFERVERITSRYEFVSVADDIYDLITNVLVGKYVLEDIGTNFMYNYGIRPGFGPVLLDFPYIYELDGAKLYCEQVLDDGTVCGGEIDYDDGFNFLTCTKCGRLYRASDLSKPRKMSGIFVSAKKRGAIDMKVEVRRGDTVIRTKDYKDTTQFMTLKKEVTRPKRVITDASELIKVPIVIGTRGKKKYKEALDEYYAKNPEAAEQKVDNRNGIFVRSYGDGDQEAVTPLSEKIPTRNANIVTKVSNDIVVETPRDVHNNNIKDNVNNISDDNGMDKAQSNISVSEVKETKQSEPSYESDNVQKASGELTPNNSEGAEELPVPPTCESDIVTAVDMHKDKNRDYDENVESNKEESNNNPVSSSSDDNTPVTPPLVMAVSFGDNSDEDTDTTVPVIENQENTTVKTDTIMRSPSLARSRSRRYDSSFYENVSMEEEKR